jgi:hypothetical protein
VGAGDDGAEDGDNLGQKILLGEDGGSSSLQSSSNVAIDVGDDGPIISLASIHLKNMWRQSGGKWVRCGQKLISRVLSTRIECV